MICSRLFKPKQLVLVPLLLALVVAVACAGAATPTPLVREETATSTPLVGEAATTPVPEARPTVQVPDYVAKGKYGGRVPLIGVADAGDLDVHHTSSLASGMAPSIPRFNNLVMFNPVNWSEIIGDLATGWEVSPDGRTYTFFIHPNAHWHDGMPVTAQDVVFSLNRIVDPNAIRPQAGPALRPFYAHGTARAIDNKTVEVPIKFPSAAFLPWLSFAYLAIYPEHVAEGLSQEQISCCYENMVGSGPWMLKEHRRGDFIQWEKNPNYFKEGLPFWDGWTSHLIPDTSRAIAGMQTEQVMGWTITFLPASDRFQQLERDTGGRVKAIRADFASQVGMGINWTQPPFDDPRVRKALMLVIDRVEIIKTVYQGFGRQADFLPGGAPIEEVEANWPGWRYVDANGDLITGDPVQVPGARKHPDDIADAKRLIQEAGAERVTGEFLAANFPQVVNETDLIIRQLREHFGWDLRAKVMDLPSVVVERNAGRYMLLTDSAAPEINDPMSILSQAHLAGGGRNFQNWHDERIDRLAEELIRATTSEERERIVLEIESILSEEGISQWVPTTWSPIIGAVNVKIRNFHLPKATDAANSWYLNAWKEHLWFDPDAKPDWGLGP